MKGIGMKNFSGYTVAAALLATATLAGCPEPELHTQVIKSGATIDGNELYFIPAVSDGSKRLSDPLYARYVQAAEPVPFTGGTVLDLTGGPVITTLDVPVMYYGELRNTIAVAPDGTIRFDGAEGGNDTLAEHFGSPQISVLPIIATAAGTVVTLFQSDEFIIVDYKNVVIGDTASGVTNNTNFQVVFHLGRGIDGDIEIIYSNVDEEATGIVGLSTGYDLDGMSEGDAERFLAGFKGSDLTKNANTDALKAPGV